MPGVAVPSVEASGSVPGEWREALLKLNGLHVDSSPCSWLENQPDDLEESKSRHF